MNRKESEKYLKLLERERERVYKNLGHVREVLESGEKGIPTHIADHATDEFEKGLEIGISDAEMKILNNIREATERIQNGQYGICAHCDKKIPETRLKAVPYALSCIKCQREIEQSEE